MANKFGDKNAISRYKKSRDGESGEDAAVADFLGSHGVDRWDNVHLHHYEDDDVWEAKFDGASVRGDSRIDALDALVHELRDRDLA
jgi:hypothetical protein